MHRVPDPAANGREVAPQTVAGAMITMPKTLADDTTIGLAIEALANPHVHLVLLTKDGILRGTLTRGDLRGTLSPTAPAIDLSITADRTVKPDQPLADTHRHMVATGQRRLAVVDTDNRLLGLLCLQRSESGFCTDTGVADRAQERATARGQREASRADRGSWLSGGVSR